LTVRSNVILFEAFVRRKIHKELAELGFRVDNAVLHEDGTLRVYFFTTEPVPDELLRRVTGLLLNEEEHHGRFVEQQPCIVSNVVNAYADFETGIRVARPRRYVEAPPPASMPIALQEVRDSA